ncbi:MAG: NADH-quinone oxidoreductase subunit NuoF [Anaerolineaceae bacterium]|nr:MAG: NADH-quinone oxidoreductase subunit NuoF [Anaerolineaceae bacterium]
MSTRRPEHRLPEDELELVSQQEQEAKQQYRHHVYVCVGAACLSAGSADVQARLEAEVAGRSIAGGCAVHGGGCRGLCVAGPTVTIEPDNVLYGQIKPDDVADILDNLGGQPVERLHRPTDKPFFMRQQRIVLELAGKVNSERIEDYLANGGYTSLIKALHEMTPAQVINEISRSGLRGRGGAGFPTGLKWRTVAKAEGDVKYVVCNGDEGDPGAFMDRSVMDDYPFRLLEGITIAAYAVGAQQGFIYIRAEYPLSVKRVQNAIRQARKMNLIGDQVVGTSFNFDLKVRVGAGAFVCGEETALLASIEGQRGQPRPRPPYPATSGLWGHPTLINNVETFANVPAIIRNGAAWFAGIGTEQSKGTKVFALTGKIAHSGLIEVPMGITLREIIYDIGGGIPNGKRFKAAQTGGPSGGCIPESHLDISVDYEALAEIGSIMGSGGMIIMDEDTCMVDVAKYFMKFCMEESCGKCIPCRVGTAQIYHLLEKITQGAATMADLELLEELCDVVKHTSLCGLGQAAPNPVVSTLRFFRDEYIAHIVDGHCPTGICPLQTPQNAIEES